MARIPANIHDIGEMWKAFGTRYGWTFVDHDPVKRDAKFTLSSGETFKCPQEVLDDIQRVHAESNVTALNQSREGTNG